MNTDWIAWHDVYADPASSLSRRLLVVQAELREHLATDSRVLSICAGDGRDVLPVLAEIAPDAQAVLVELDADLVGRAERTATELGLTGVDVRIADAGDAAVYSDIEPVDVVLACGVFGNIDVADARTTIATLPSLLTDGGVIIWTRGRGDEGPDPSLEIRDLFAQSGFRELSYTAPEDARFRVGSHRLVDRNGRMPLIAGARLFSFVR